MPGDARGEAPRFSASHFHVGLEARLGVAVVEKQGPHTLAIVAEALAPVGRVEDASHVGGLGARQGRQDRVFDLEFVQEEERTFLDAEAGFDVDFLAVITRSFASLDEGAFDARVEVAAIPVEGADRERERAEFTFDEVGATDREDAGAFARPKAQDLLVLDRLVSFDLEFLDEGPGPFAHLEGDPLPISVLAAVDLGRDPRVREAARDIEVLEVERGVEERRLLAMPLVDDEQVLDDTPQLEVVKRVVADEAPNDRVLRLLVRWGRRRTREEARGAERAREHGGDLCRPLQSVAQDHWKRTR